MKKVSYRVLESKDLINYRTVRLDCLKNFPDNFGTQIHEEPAISSEVYEKYILSPSADGFFFGAFNASDLIGLSGFIRSSRKKTAHRGELIQVYVDPLFSGKGVGKNLIYYTIEKAFENIQIEQILLSAVKTNSKATQLYEKIGFKKYASLTDYFKEGNTYWTQVFMRIYREDFDKQLIK